MHFHVSSLRTVRVLALALAGSFAAAQAGTHESKRQSYGHSLIIAPWGEILAEGGVEPGVFLAEIDPAKVETARKTIPSLQHGRRFSVADPKAGPDYLHLVREPT